MVHSKDPDQLGEIRVAWGPHFLGIPELEGMVVLAVDSRRGVNLLTKERPMCGLSLTTLENRREFVGSTNPCTHIDL